MILGQLRIKDFLLRTVGQVRGRLVSDAKRRWYAADYQWEAHPSGDLLISRTDGTGDRVRIQPVIDLDESLIAFFGLYSGDLPSSLYDCPGHVRIGLVQPIEEVKKGFHRIESFLHNQWPV